MAFAFKQIEAHDPNNPGLVAPNAMVTIFEPGDPAMTPLTLTTLTGQALANPVKVNGLGYGPAFMHATLSQVAWSGGGLTGTFESYEGMRDEAIAARDAANTAAANAAAEAQAAIGDATVAAEAAADAADASALAAANSAALVGAPADSAIATAINASGSETKAALSATTAQAIAATSELPAWAGTSRPNQFNAARSTYNWKPGNTQRITAALAKAITGGAAVFGAMGDSETYGYNAQGVAPWSVSWPKRAQDALVAAGYPRRGHLYRPPATYPLGGWTQTGGVIGTTGFTTVPNAATLTYASEDTGTEVEVYYFNNGASFTVKIDAAAAVAVTTTGAQTYGKYKVTGLASSTHTVTITGQGNAYIAGVAVRQTTGVEFNNYGSNGAIVAMAAGANNFEDTAFAKHRGISINAATTDAFFIALGVNDVRFPLTDAQIKPALTSLVVAAKATGADVVLVSEMEVTNLSSGAAIAADRWASFMSMYYDVADEQDIPLIDVGHVFGSPARAIALGTSANDGVPHPSQAGYAVKGRTVAKALL